MSDYTEINTDNLLPGKPLTSAIAQALNENLLATGEGAPGAPKIVSEALNMLVGVGSGTTSFTNLERVDKVLLDGTALWSSGAGFGQVQYRTSTDNGSTWGSYVTFTGPASSAPIIGVGRRVVSLGASNNAIGIRLLNFGPFTGTFSFSVLGVSGVSP